MYLYRQTIVLFGIVAPMVAAAAVIGISFMLKSRMVSSFNNKQSNYKTYEQGRIAGLEIEAQVTRQRQHLDRWSENLAQETASAVATNLRSVIEDLPSKEIQQTAFERPSGSAGFGTVAAQKSSQVRISFRGTYRTLQRAFLELETRMPQLQLQELRMDPVANQTSLMNFQVAYTAWEN